MKKLLFTLLAVCALSFVGQAQAVKSTGIWYFQGAPNVNAPAPRGVEIAVSIDEGKLYLWDRVLDVWFDPVERGSVNGEEVEDIIGAILTRSTHSGISVTYDDVSGTISLDSEVTLQVLQDSISQAISSTVISIQPGLGVNIDNTDPKNPIVGVDANVIATRGYVDSLDMDAITFDPTGTTLTSTNGGDALRELENKLLEINSDLGNTAFISTQTGYQDGIPGNILNPYSFKSAMNTVDSLPKYHLSGDLFIDTAFILPLEFYSNGTVTFDAWSGGAAMSNQDAAGEKEYNLFFNNVVLKNTFGGNRFLFREQNTTNKMNFYANNITFQDGMKFINSGGLFQAGNVKVRNQEANYCVWLGASEGAQSTVVADNVDVGDNSRLFSALATYPGTSVSQNTGMDYTYSFGNYKKKGWGQIISSSFSSSDMRSSTVSINVKNYRDTTQSFAYNPYTTINPNHTASAPRIITLGTTGSATADSVKYIATFENVISDQTILLQTPSTTNSDFFVKIGSGSFMNTPSIHTQGGGANNRFYLECQLCESFNTPSISINADGYTEISGSFKSYGVLNPTITASKDFYLKDANLEGDSLLIDSNVPITVYTCNTNITQDRVGANVTLVDCSNSNGGSLTGSPEQILFFGNDGNATSSDDLFYSSNGTLRLDSFSGAAIDAYGNLGTNEQGRLFLSTHRVINWVYNDTRSTGEWSMRKGGGTIDNPTLIGPGRQVGKMTFETHDRSRYSSIQAAMDESGNFVNLHFGPNAHTGAAPYAYESQNGNAKGSHLSLWGSGTVGMHKYGLGNKVIGSLTNRTASNYLAGFTTNGDIYEIHKDSLGLGQSAESNFYNVVEWGADLTDTLSDLAVYREIRDTIMARKQFGGATIYTPAGTVVFEDSLEIHIPNLKIVGAGIGKTMFTVDLPNQEFGNYADYFTVWSDNVTFESFSYNGRFKPADWSFSFGSDGVLALKHSAIAFQDSSDNCVVRNVDIRATTRHGILVEGNYHVIDGVTIDSTNSANVSFAFGKGNQLLNSKIGYSKGKEGFQLQDKASNSTVSGVQFNAHQPIGGNSLAFSTISHNQPNNDVAGLLVENCSFDSIGFTGVALRISGRIDENNVPIIHQNLHFRGITVNQGLFLVTSYVDGLTIEGCDINSGQGLYVGQVQNDPINPQAIRVNNTRILNNTIQPSAVNASQAVEPGITIESARNTRIEGNTIIGGSQSIVMFGGADTIAIRNNTIRESGQHAIVALGPVTEVVASGNIITNNPNRAFTGLTQGDFTIFDNVVTGNGNVLSEGELGADDLVYDNVGYNSFEDPGRVTFDEVFIANGTAGLPGGNSNVGQFIYQDTDGAWKEAFLGGHNSEAIAVITDFLGSQTYTIQYQGLVEHTSHGLTVGQTYFLQGDGSFLPESNVATDTTFKLIDVISNDEYLIQFKRTGPRVTTQQLLDSLNAYREHKAFYTDNTYTQAVPFTILDGTVDTFPFQALTTTTFPATGNYYDNATSRITPEFLMGGYEVTLRFSARTTSIVNNGVLNFKMYIGDNVSGGFGEIEPEKIDLTRGTTWNNYKVTFTGFTGATFLANGGQIRIEAVNSDVEIAGVFIDADDDGTNEQSTIQMLIKHQK